MYLPNSDKDTVICEAYVDNYDHDDKRDSWGYGVSPIRFGVLSGKGANPKTYHYLDSNENAVYLGVQESGTANRFRATVDLITFNPTYTVYFVGKVHSGNSWPCVIGNTQWNFAMFSVDFYNNTTFRIEVVNNQNKTITTSIDKNNWFVVALKSNGNQIVSNKGIMYYYASAMSGTVEQTPFVTFDTPANIQYANDKISFGTPNSETRFCTETPDARWDANLLVRYVGVTNVFESDSVISQNMQNLASEFL